MGLEGPVASDLIHSSMGRIFRHGIRSGYKSEVRKAVMGIKQKSRDLHRYSMVPLALCYRL